MAWECDSVKLEGIAKPGAICLSEDAFRQVRARLDLAVSDLGQTHLKNIAEAIGAYSIEVGLPACAKSTLPTEPAVPTQFALPDKPSIAVLPFQNMSGDPEQEYFADGIVEDIITGLSRITWLFVIARNSSFTYKGKAMDVRQVGRELGVRYVLEGGVRKAGKRLRITAQLLEAETGAHLWANIITPTARWQTFSICRIRSTEQVVGIFEPSLLRSEIERSRRKRPENLDAYDLFLRALPHARTLRPADAKLAIPMLEEALKLDPNYAAAQAYIASCHQIYFVYGGFDETEKAAGLWHARAVIERGTDDATALALAAIVIVLMSKDYDAALSAIEHALMHNASSATAHYYGALINAFSANFLAPSQDWLKFEGGVISSL